jgi:hypothetical protein
LLAFVSFSCLLDQYPVLDPYLEIMDLEMTFMPLGVNIPRGWRNHKPKFKQVALMGSGGW